MKTKKNLFTHLNIQMAAFFLAANFIFLLICSALYYQWAFQILLENSEKLHIQSMQQTQHRIEQTLDEADRAVNLLSYGNTGQKILAHSGSETDIDSILLFRNYLSSHCKVGAFFCQCRAWPGMAATAPARHNSHSPGQV